MDEIWKLSQNLNVCIYGHAYKEAMLIIYLKNVLIFKIQMFISQISLKMLHILLLKIIVVPFLIAFVRSLFSSFF